MNRILTIVIGLLLLTSCVSFVSLFDERCASATTAQALKTHSLGKMRALPSKIGGVAYVAWNDSAYNLTCSVQSIALINKTNSDSMTIFVDWFMDTVSSTKIYPYHGATPSDLSLVHAIQVAHSYGIAVTLKPQVLCLDGQWSGNIKFNTTTDWDTWFQNLTLFMDHYATIAQQNNVEMFVIGTELDGTLSQTSIWQAVITNIRSIYAGPLTYAVNHGNENNVGFWNNLDYIGIDAYYDLTSQNDPTLSQLNSAWSNIWNVVQAWHNLYYSSKQIVFCEIGYRSMQGANKNPSDFKTNGTVDMQEQYNCYLSALQTVWNASDFKGLYWWAWDATPNQGGPADNGYSPHNKPAEGLITAWFDMFIWGAPSAPYALNATSGSGQVGLSWATPTLAGISAISNYDIFRGTASGAETYLATVGIVNSYTDTAVVGGQTYYYTVKAKNTAVRDSVASNEASATPTGIVPETPLSPFPLIIISVILITAIAVRRGRDD